MSKNKAIGIESRNKIYQFILTYIEQHGYAPTIREISDGTELRSTSTVQHHVKVLMEDGMLETDAGIGSPRAIRVPGYKFVKVENEDFETNKE